MSWLSGLTSKAEAMLVKLDQDAAQALQKPQGLLRGTKIIDQALNTISTYRGEDKIDNDIEIENKEEQSNGEVDASFVEINSGIVDNNIFENSLIQNNNTNYVVGQQDKQQLLIDKSSNVDNNVQTNHNLNGQTVLDSDNTNITVNSKDVPMSSSDNNPSTWAPSTTMSNQQQAPNLTPQPTTSKTNLYSRKFVIQTSRNSGSKAFNSTYKTSQQNVLKKDQYGINKTVDNSNGLENEMQSVEDIRASIRKTLEEYANQSPYENNTEKQFETNSHTTHFDNEPTLIKHNNLNDHNSSLSRSPTNSPSTNRIHSSPSFSIELPDVHDFNSSTSTSSDIALQLLQQTALKKKSTFNIHKVLNRLANPNGMHTNAIITGDMKIKLRRFKMRMGSYARRLNYYYRTNPMMKYVMIGYLILMQILVIYVLFFYQSSGSNNLNDLSNQINEQQEKLQRE